MAEAIGAGQPPDGGGSGSGNRFDPGGMVGFVANPFIWLISAIGGGFVLLFLYRRSRDGDDRGPNGLQLAGATAGAGGSRTAAAPLPASPPVPSRAAAAVASVEAAPAAKGRRGRPKESPVATAPVGAAALVEAAADPAEPLDDDPPIDEDRPLASVRHASPTSPEAATALAAAAGATADAVPAIVDAEAASMAEPTLADPPSSLDAVDGAFAAAVAAKRTRTKRAKDASATESAPTVEAAVAPTVLNETAESDVSPAPVAAAEAMAGPVAAATVQSSAASTPAQTFAKSPAKGVERVKVGYRLVRISSKPDAVRSVELGRLDRGDEVEILDSYEGFLQVRTPGGVTGWILRHTIVGAPST